RAARPNSAARRRCCAARRGRPRLRWSPDAAAGERCATWGSAKTCVPCCLTARAAGQPRTITAPSIAVMHARHTRLSASTCVALGKDQGPYLVTCSYAHIACHGAPWRVLRTDLGGGERSWPQPVAPT